MAPPIGVVSCAQIHQEDVDHAVNEMQDGREEKAEVSEETLKSPVRVKTCKQRNMMYELVRYSRVQVGNSHNTTQDCVIQ